MEKCTRDEKSMKLDGQSQRFLNLMTAGAPGRITDYHASDIRKVDEERHPIDLEARKLVASVDDREIDGPNGGVPIRIYHPRDVKDPPTVVYFHGGGFCISSVDVYDHFCCLLSKESTAIVVSVDYRLAPEHKFPQGLHDAWAAYRWVLGNREALGTSSTKIAVAGDSAGGGLVASVTLMAKAAGAPQPDFQVLIYPHVAGDLDAPSRDQFAEGYFVTREKTSYYMNLYVTRPEELRDPLVTPLLAEDLSGLPDALIITAEFDPLRDDGAHYAQRLKEAGVDVIYTEYGKTLHAFLKRPGQIEKGVVATAQIGATLRSVLTRGWDA